MSWKDEADEIQRRRELAREQGGAEAVSRHHAAGRLTVRERIDALTDKGSFREVGGLTGQAERDDEGRLTAFTPTNVVTGVARLDGRPVVVGGDDFTSASPLNVLSMQTLAAVPVVCAALGPVAGFPAARLVASHPSIMTRDTAQVLTGGPGW